MQSTHFQHQILVVVGQVVSKFGRDAVVQTTKLACCVLQQLMQPGDSIRVLGVEILPSFERQPDKDEYKRVFVRMDGTTRLPQSLSSQGHFSYLESFHLTLTAPTLFFLLILLLFLRLSPNFFLL